MINTLAAIHAASRARRQHDAGAKPITVEVRKRRKPRLTIKEPHAQSDHAKEKSDD